MNHVLHFVYVCVCTETLKVNLRLSAYVTRVVLTHTEQEENVQNPTAHMHAQRHV